jgi:uncharacterized protein YutE (UPF0331/DUF86 family)
MDSEKAVRKRLAELKKNISILRDLQALSYADLVSNTEKLWALEHGLQISIQIVLDVGNQLLADKSENNIEDYAGVITRLGEVGIVPKDFSDKIRHMAGFRNILVHEYAELDLREVYRVLHENLSDFETFGRYIESYLAGAGGRP